jgi:hypothetical protein
VRRTVVAVSSFAAPPTIQYADHEPQQRCRSSSSFVVVVRRPAPKAQRTRLTVGAGKQADV